MIHLSTTFEIRVPFPPATDVEAAGVAVIQIQQYYNHRSIANQKVLYFHYSTPALRMIRFFCLLTISMASQRQYIHDMVKPACPGARKQANTPAGRSAGVFVFTCPLYKYCTIP